MYHVFYFSFSIGIISDKRKIVEKSTKIARACRRSNEAAVCPLNHVRAHRTEYKELAKKVKALEGSVSEIEMTVTS